MLVEHVVGRAVVAQCSNSSVATSVLFCELIKTVVWQTDLVLQVAVFNGDGNLRVFVVSVNAEVHAKPPPGLSVRESEIHLCVPVAQFFVLSRRYDRSF